MPRSISQFQFQGHINHSPITRLGIVGPGDVFLNKISPALLSGKPRFHQIAVCGVEAECRLPALKHIYYPVEPGNLLPLDSLYRDGFLTSDTLWLITTPSQLHVPYALQLVGLCGRVAVEKPIARDARQAQLLRPFAYNRSGVYPIDHKLFNSSALEFVEKCRRDPALVDRIRHVQGTFYETAGFAKGRAQENTIADIQWHLLAILIAVFKSGASNFEIEIHSCESARHASDPAANFADAQFVTASRLTGALLKNASAVRFDLMQAKAAPTGDKRMRFFGERNELIGEIDLNESRWHAHGRVIEALLQPVVDMRHTLDDAITLAEVLECARLETREHRRYEFGCLPSFLSTELVAAQLLEA